MHKVQMFDMLLSLIERGTAKKKKKTERKVFWSICFLNKKNNRVLKHQVQRKLGTKIHAERYSTVKNR